MDMMNIDPVTFLNDLFQAGLAAADPLKVLPPYLPEKPKGRVVVIGAGKASAAMARAVELSWPDVDMHGCVVTRYDYGVPTDKIRIIEAAHPVPDQAGRQAAQEILQTVSGLEKDDLVLCLISGGGSALLTAPAPCLNETEKQNINKALLRSGATIHEMNTVRKHLSLIKGGNLVLAASPARVVTMMISDVPGDDPDVIASGPTLPDRSTQGEALDVITRYEIEVSDAVRAWLSDPVNETPKPGDPRFDGHESVMIAKCQNALDAAADYAKKAGITPVLIGDDLQGEARILGQEHIRKALGYNGTERPYVVISGGETTVTVRGQGKGGRNTEYLLGALLEARGRSGLYGLACDTDGIDGSEDNAGAVFSPATWDVANQNNLDGQSYLDRNDAYSFFAQTQSLIETGPTFTNVNDLRAILVTAD